MILKTFFVPSFLPIHQYLYPSVTILPIQMMGGQVCVKLECVEMFVYSKARLYSGCTTLDWPVASLNTQVSGQYAVNLWSTSREIYG